MSNRMEGEATYKQISRPSSRRTASSTDTSSPSPGILTVTRRLRRLGGSGATEFLPTKKGFSALSSISGTRSRESVKTVKDVSAVSPV